MDHEAIRHCPFTDACDAYGDPMIPWSRQERKRRGCLEQTDVYRNRHCTSFRCMYLTRVVSEVLRARPAASR
jgi:hypothetical protein